MLIYNYDHAGLLTGSALADESPLEPGVYLLPARCTTEPPPTGWPEDKWPRWNGAAWSLANKPEQSAEPTAVEKLAAFLAANPDVAELVEPPAPV
ncbi:MAG: phage tail protein [Halopseudomonas sp.]|uniref:phage tail protein n=1 Tax=Halopseudomonas sp. TaxID=2901191 RepID=UPI0030014CA4